MFTLSFISVQVVFPEPDVLSSQGGCFFRVRFLDLVEGRAEFAGLTKMKDISLKGIPGVSGERTVNKIQDFVWDECLGSYSLLPQVRLTH